MADTTTPTDESHRAVYRAVLAAALGSADARPDDCDCGPLGAGLPCWPCYRDGFTTAPAEG